ncbi:DUF4393 domain-containing protein [Sphingomonas koreensis]|nr:DUF4393 domain-containing protein [Sphingomonas koreensis]
MEIVSAASLLASAGAGTWLADKLLGPSFQALGEQFRAFAGKRLTAIFSRAEELVDPSKVKALPPGFALQFIQKASFSEDDPQITDMWAGLLADAAQGISNKHNIFVDILSQIGSKEAKFIDEIFDAHIHYLLVEKIPTDLRPTLFESAKRASIDWPNSKTEEQAAAVADHLMNFQFGWPAIVRFAESYWSIEGSPGKTEWVRRTKPFEDSFVIDALSRQRLIEYFEIDFSPGWASPRMDGYFMTLLGVQFVQACRREVEAP